MFLLDNFKQYGEHKEIPEWVKYLPEKFKLQLFKGYLESDGCVMRKENRTSINIVSISLNLLEGIQDILFSLGYISSITLLRKKSIRKIQSSKVFNCKETYYLHMNNYDSINILTKLKLSIKSDISFRDRNTRYCHFSKDLKNIYFLVENVKKSNYEGTVYNFQTKTGTFMCRNILTHNCDIAKGTGEHYSTCQVLKITSTDPFKAEQVAVFQDNYTDVYEYSKIIYRLALYYNNAYLLIENNIGDTVISEL
jgi:intein/homing endonuclease